MPVAFAQPGDAILPGRILIAPPDHHLLVRRSLIGLSRGPAENWARPAIDPLFRTASAAYGPRVIGVIMTGMLTDGTAGLIAVRKAGGLGVVQDPAEAAHSTMPASALAHAGADYCCKLAQMPSLLERLAENIAAGSPSSEMEISDGRPRR
jgi:two-component system chemotaxis response regulator CheB